MNVDDTAMQTIGPEWPKLQDVMSPCMQLFAKEVDKLNLKLSPKAAAVSSDMRCTNAFVQEMEQSDPPIFF